RRCEAGVAGRLEVAEALHPHRPAAEVTNLGGGPDGPLPNLPSHSFKAPASSPRIRKRPRPITIRIGGRLARIDAAAMSPHGTSNTPGKSASATGTVRLDSLAVKV